MGPKHNKMILARKKSAHYTTLSRRFSSPSLVGVYVVVSPPCSAQESPCFGASPPFIGGYKYATLSLHFFFLGVAGQRNMLMTQSSSSREKEGVRAPIPYTTL